MLNTLEVGLCRSEHRTDRNFEEFCESSAKRAFKQVHRKHREKTESLEESVEVLSGGH